MRGSDFNGWCPDFGPLFWLAGFGFFCAVACGLGAIGFGIWFAVHHLQFV